MVAPGALAPHHAKAPSNVVSSEARQRLAHLQILDFEKPVTGGIKHSSPLKTSGSLEAMLRRWGEALVRSTLALTTDAEGMAGCPQPAACE
jgi:hypothetical protein